MFIIQILGALALVGKLHPTDLTFLLDLLFWAEIQGEAIVTRGNPSGYKLNHADVAVVFGMQKRGDRDHDIAAWFGVNQGRIAEAKDGKFGNAQPAPADQLPPKGPPGVKGKRLRWALNKIIATAKEDPNKMQQVIAALEVAVVKFDANEA